MPLDRLGPSHVPAWSGIAATSERPASLLASSRLEPRNPIQSVYGDGDGDGDSDGVGVGDSDDDDGDGDGNDDE